MAGSFKTGFCISSHCTVMRSTQHIMTMCVIITGRYVTDRQSYSVGRPRRWTLHVGEFTRQISSAWMAESWYSLSTCIRGSVLSRGILLSLFLQL